MAVRIRLSRIGKKKAPFFRIVAVDGREKRDGKFLENLGTYNPLTGEIIQFHVEKLNNWVQKGAIPSDTVTRIVKQFERGIRGVQDKKVVEKKAASAKPVQKEVQQAEAKKD